MRNKFIDYLIKRNRKYRDTFLLVGDLGYGLVESFEENFPEFYINVGIAEQNMATIAAGISSEGYRVFCYSIANFNTFRCAEQIRNDIDYHELPVCTVSVGGGLAYGNLGYSHHAIQDYALMRSFPNTTIFSPADPLETEFCLDLIYEINSSSYLRLHKANEKILNPDKWEIKPGLPRFIAGNIDSGNIILTTGYAAHGAYKFLKESNQLSKYSLHTVPCWGMKYKNLIAKYLEKFNQITTIEDHLKDGGFGSWILECINESKNNQKVIIKGFEKNIIGLVGDENYMHKASKLFDLWE